MQFLIHSLDHHIGRSVQRSSLEQLALNRWTQSLYHFVSVLPETLRFDAFGVHIHREHGAKGSVSRHIVRGLRLQIERGVLLDNGTMSRPDFSEIINHFVSV